MYDTSEQSTGTVVAFDGLDGALGHAFLPGTGEIHLDLDEQWTIGRVPENNGKLRSRQ